MTSAELKASILDRAVRGLLVPQDPNDEPAAELLAKIAAEKKHLLSTGKIKKQKPTDPIDSHPFELPSSWAWVRFGDIVNFITGKTPSRHDSTAWGRDVPWVSISDMVADGHITETAEYVTSKAIANDFSGRISPRGTMIMSFKLTIGKISIIDIDAVHNEAIISIFPFEPQTQEFLFKILPFISVMGDSKNAIMGKTLNSTSLNNLLIPLPPLAEQKRIVARIEELMPLVEEYGKAETELAALNDNFPTALRKSILQHAVEGHLTAAWRKANPRGETAAELLAKIAAEKKHLLASGKIKKQKPLPPITDDERPFPIPDGWEWVRLGEIGTWGSGATPSKSNNAYYKNGTIPWLLTGDLNDGDITEIPGTITPLALEETSVKLNQPESVLIAMYGATIGKVGILKIAATTNQACCACQPFGGIYNKFLFYYLMSQRDTFQKRGEGGAQPNISKEKIVATLFPLPPLAEQKAIVERVEELLNLIEKMK